MSAWFGRVGTPNALPEGKPSVWLITNSSCTEADAKKLAAGCEEEGVPLAWDVRPGSAAELARAACLRSHLEVGVGIDEKNEAAIAIVHVSDHPYVTGIAEGPEELRWFGQAAARISKSQPVPGKRGEEDSFPEGQNEEPSRQESCSEEQDKENPVRGAAVESAGSPLSGSPDIDMAELVRAVMGALSAAGQNNGKEGGRT